MAIMTELERTVTEKRNRLFDAIVHPPAFDKWTGVFMGNILVIIYIKTMDGYFAALILEKVNINGKCT